MMSHDPGAWEKKRIRSLTEIMGHWHDLSNSPCACHKTKPGIHYITNH